MTNPKMSKVPILRDYPVNCCSPAALSSLQRYRPCCVIVLAALSFLQRYRPCCHHMLHNMDHMLIRTQPRLPDLNF